jgi:hypothetical protein
MMAGSLGVNREGENASGHVVGAYQPEIEGRSHVKPDTLSRKGARAEQTCSGGYLGKRSRKPYLVAGSPAATDWWSAVATTWRLRAGRKV